MRVRHHERRLRARFLPGEGLVRCRRHASQRPQHTTGGTDAQKHGRRTARTRGRTAPSRRCLRPASSSMRACPIVDLGRARRRAVRARMASHRSARRVLPVLPGVPRGCLGDVDGGRCCDDQAVASGSISPGPGWSHPGQGRPTDPEHRSRHPHQPRPSPARSRNVTHADEVAALGCGSRPIIRPLAS